MSNINSFCLVNPNRTNVKRFSINNKSEDRSGEDIFIDSGKSQGHLDIKTIYEEKSFSKINENSEIYKRLLFQGWRKN